MNRRAPHRQTVRDATACQHHVRRCEHGLAFGLCVMADCPHWDHGRTRPPSYEQLGLIHPLQGMGRRRRAKLEGDE